MTILVSRHHIKKSHALYRECDFLCFVTKNLYNHCLYHIRNYGFFKDDHGFTLGEDASVFARKTKTKTTKKTRAIFRQTGFTLVSSLIKINPVKLKPKNATRLKKQNCITSSKTLPNFVPRIIRITREDR